ncbi:hypothetical protein BC829DRAFT_379916 [Chytridium lagenaria]|nr:hypothetical protein BC829DRAFT_379916 [Chytridium lagenaria]
MNQTLSLSLLNEHFGDVVEKVAGALLTKGRLTAPMIVSATKLPSRRVHESLYVLMRQTNLVHYRIHGDKILARDRFPWYLWLADDLFGEEGARLTSELLKHGYLSLKQMKALVDNFDRVLPIFHEMADRGLITTLVPNSIFQDKDYTADSEEAYDPISTSSKKRSAPDRGAAEHASKKWQSKDSSERELSNDHWCVNYSVFHSYLRCSALSKLIGQERGIACEEIVAAFLQPDGKELSMETKTTSMSTISSRIRPGKVPNYVTRSSSWIDEHLSGLLQDPSRIITREEEKGGGQYKFNLRNGVDYLKKNVIESHIEINSARLLYIKGKLNDAEISKIAMVSGKTARQNLSSLLQSGMVSIQEVPRTADYAAARNFYLWYVSLSKCVQNLGEFTYQVLLNLKIRRGKLLEENYKLIEKSERSDVIADPSALLDWERASLDKFYSTMGILRVSEIRLSKSLLILKDFEIE